jgi:electron transfer flavoprotein beta subunit
MNILICIKQVPDTNEILMDEERHTLIRSKAANIVNPFDMYSLEIAARLQENRPNTKVVIVSMGPLHAEEAIRTCFSIVGDIGYLISDPRFSGSDTLATSYILSQAVRLIENTEGTFDLILCGKQAIDGDTAQVGPELAEHLAIAQVTNVIEVTSEETLLTVTKETETGYAICTANTPCLLTITKLSREIRIPSLKKKLSARKIPLEHRSLKELVGLDEQRIGLQGSPTRVVKTFTIPRKTSCTFFTGPDAVKELMQTLQDNNHIQEVAL